MRLTKSQDFAGSKPNGCEEPVVGRHNWLSYGSDKGGRTAAVLSSLIATCKRLRVEPFAYLRDLFTRISAPWGTGGHLPPEFLRPQRTNPNHGVFQLALDRAWRQTAFISILYAQRARATVSLLADNSASWP